MERSLLSAIITSLAHFQLLPKYFEIDHVPSLLTFKVHTNYVGGYIIKLPQKHSYNSILAAYPLLSIFSVLEDMNNSVWYVPSVVNFKVKGHTFSQMRMNQPLPCPSALVHMVCRAT